MKRCSGCGETKGIAGFSRDASRGDGLEAYCKACKSIRNAEYRRRNHEYCIERVWKCRRNNGAEYNATAREKRETDPAKYNAQVTAWRAANREAFNARRRVHYALNCDKLNAQTRARVARNREAYNARALARYYEKKRRIKMETDRDALLRQTAEPAEPDYEHVKQATGNVEPVTTSEPAAAPVEE